jgi:hypothetical protein
LNLRHQRRGRLGHGGMGGGGCGGNRHVETPGVSGV